MTCQDLVQKLRFTRRATLSDARGIAALKSEEQSCHSNR